MKRLWLPLALVAGSASAFASTDVWTPRADFSLEGGTLQETMHWVSGWSYALTEVGKSTTKPGSKPLFCLPREGYIESRVMFEILNERYKGKRITSEQAAAALWAGVLRRYPCGKQS